MKRSRGNQAVRLVRRLSLRAWLRQTLFGERTPRWAWSCAQYRRFRRGVRGRRLAGHRAIWGEVVSR